MADGEYQAAAQTDDYEVGVKDDRIIAACRCGDGLNVPNKGLGRATVAAWRTRHQHTAPTGGPAVFAFCEQVTATTLSREHIRRVGPEGLKPGGGIPEGVTALCGYDIARGWDNPGSDVTERNVARGQQAETNPVCTGCADTWCRDRVGANPQEPK